ELPEDAIETTDLCDRPAGSPENYGRWRRHTTAADESWDETRAFTPRPRRERARDEAPVVPAAAGVGTTAYAEGMLVKHDKYGVGRITQVSGSGAACKVKIRFGASGERTFIADKARLQVVRKR